MTIVSNIPVDYKKCFFILLGLIMLLGFYFFVESEKNQLPAMKVKVLVPAAAVAVVTAPIAPVAEKTEVQNSHVKKAVADFKESSNRKDYSGTNVVKYKKFRTLKEIEYNLEAEYQKIYGND